MIAHFRKALLLASLAAYLATIVGGHALHELACPCGPTVSCDHSVDAGHEHGAGCHGESAAETAIAAGHGAWGHDADTCPICHLLAQAQLPGAATLALLPAEPAGYRTPAATTAPALWPTVLYSARAPPFLG